MTEISLRDPQTLDDVGLSREQLGIIEEIRTLEKNQKIVNATWVPNTTVREYKEHYSVPYGGALKKPKIRILEAIRRARDFIAERTAFIQIETPDCVDIMNTIKDKANRILEMG